MGDPKKNKKKFAKPAHPWQKERIEQENELQKEYGLKNKREIWKMRAPLDHFKTRAKSIVSLSAAEAAEEQKNLIAKLSALGLVNEGATLDDVLSLNVKNILERRLQTLVFRKGYARTIKQARQFITHEHIMVKGVSMNAPSYLVSKEEEMNLSYVEKSPLTSPDHPEVTKAAAVPPEEPKRERPSRKAGKKGGAQA